MEPGPHVVPKQEPEAELTAASAFDAVFWPLYPRKIKKHKARLAWAKLRLKDDDQATLDAIVRGLEAYIANEWDLERMQFIPHASTWLNDRCWEDFE